MRKAARAIVVKDDALLVMHRNKFGNEYFTLVGGAIKPVESPEQAVCREVHEETGLIVSNPRLVLVEDAGDPYGPQYIYVCDYRGGEVALPSDSEEAQIHALGSNLYTPLWLPVKELPDVKFLSENLKAAVIKGLLQGFPNKPVIIKTY